MRYSLVLTLTLLAGASPACAQTLVREFSWVDLKNAGQLAGGEVEMGGPSAHQDCLKIENRTDQPKTVTLLDVTPLILGNFRTPRQLGCIQGTIRCQDVTKDSYVEMHTWYANGRTHSVRAWNDRAGKLRIEGSSDWRLFQLPFIFGRDIPPVPTRIVVNVMLGGRGTVYFTPLRLEKPYDPLRDPWWTEQVAGWIGAIGGSVCGLLGAVIGIVGGFGKARRFVLTLTAFLMGLGLASLVAGMVAVILGQPYAVYYPFLLLGIVLAVVCGGILPALRHSYAQRELRRMAAMDAR